jgi:Na+(H+)/acetate symporter ActP
VLSTWILAVGHVNSAMCWLGGGVVFAFVVAPALRKLSPASSGEFLLKVVPNVVRFIQIFAGLTILFGFLLLYNLGGSSLLSGSGFYSVDLSIGIVLALAAFFLAEFVSAPLQLKAVQMVRDMTASGAHQPPAECPRTLRRASMSALLTVTLLILTSICMIGAGFY